MTCTDSIVHEIEHVLESVGNKHPYPMNIGKHEGAWTATIEIDSTQLTDDAEGRGATPAEAWRNALTSLRRKLTST